MQASSRRRLPLQPSANDPPFTPAHSPSPLPFLPYPRHWPFPRPHPSLRESHVSHAVSSLAVPSRFGSSSWHLYSTSSSSMTSFSRRRRLPRLAVRRPDVYSRCRISRIPNPDTRAPSHGPLSSFPVPLLLLLLLLPPVYDLQDSLLNVLPRSSTGAAATLQGARMS